MLLLNRCRKFILAIIDVVIVNMALFSAIYIQRLPVYVRRGSIFELVNNQIFLVVALTAIAILVFYLFNLYKCSWLFAGIREYAKIYIASIVVVIINAIILQMLGIRFAKAIMIIWALLLIVGIGTSRALYKIAGLYFRSIPNRVDRRTKKIMIVGAGSAGSLIIRDMFMRKDLGTVVVAIDDDATKKNTKINGVLIAGDTSTIPHMVEKYNVDEIIISIAKAHSESINRIIEICTKTKCKVKILPTISDFIQDKEVVTQLKDINIIDLLGRDEISLNISEITGYIQGEVVLVTGGGGSIGSELCRQIAKHKPKLLIVFDIYENNAYDLQNELLTMYGDRLNLKVLIGSIRDYERMKDVFKEYKPTLVFHAAAHKHVPLMEDSPNEALKNNVLGTRNVAKCADKFHSKRFVLISTDKAVNPTNIMGVSKRIAEIVVQNMSKTSKTKFAAVRFGNVLGSNGSVIPLFQKQIAEGGPVKVTHPDIIRYFMTIPEAAQLVLQAGELAEGGEIFILDMGKPVKIVELAKDLIRLSGFEPDVDIKIVFTGLRPGEKMYEELLLDKTSQKATKNDKIFIEPPVPDDHSLPDEINELKENLSCDCDLLEDIASHITPFMERVLQITKIEKNADKLEQFDHKSIS